MSGFRSIDERTIVHFTDNPTYLLEAYADSGEGLDRAGGFAVQVKKFRLLKELSANCLYLSRVWVACSSAKSMAITGTQSVSLQLHFSNG